MVDRFACSISDNDSKIPSCGATENPAVCMRIECTVGRPRVTPAGSQPAKKH